MMLPILTGPPLNSTDNDSNLDYGNNPYVTLSKQKLYYMNIQGLSKQANQIACKTCDESFIALLEEYIARKNNKALKLVGSDNNQSQNLINLEVDQENAIIGNPIIARYKNPLEESSKPNEGIGGRKNQQNKCGLCNNIGHNRATCPSNPNWKKKKI